MHLGLVGGIGPAATDYYYRRLIALAHERGHSLEATIVHADSPTLLANMAGGDSAVQLEIYARLAERLERAGAEVVAITSISGHFCVEAFKETSPLPVCDILETISAGLVEAGYARVGVLGTRGTMESALFGGVSTAEVVAPRGESIGVVHDAYVKVAASGVADPMSRRTLVNAGRVLVQEEGVDAVLLGGTDLVVVMDGDDVDYPVVDCAGLHIEALAGLMVESA